MSQLPDNVTVETWSKAWARFDAYWFDYLHATCGLTKADVEEAVRRERVALVRVVDAAKAAYFDVAAADLMRGNKKYADTVRLLIRVTRLGRRCIDLGIIGFVLSVIVHAAEGTTPILSLAHALLGVLARIVWTSHAKRALTEPYQPCSFPDCPQRAPAARGAVPE